MHPSAVNQQWRRLAYEVLLFDTAASRPARWVLSLNCPALLLGIDDAAQQMTGVHWAGVWRMPSPVCHDKSDLQFILADLTLSCRHVPLASVQENPVTAGAANGAASPCFSSGSKWSTSVLCRLANLH
jgi:hypothetical protein